ncbi:unnamed protein product [Microthlaspi erraticum]|uniref:Arabidopsis retrotransposon Orf1 C-terminal domain-containing protein n=1 Tax=Microthlaspi erraticum TaxID=1685480 RepID=A0A6D2JB04_9BRAS|nr:unnamed protein product [Microthlaspi erraticum]
MARNRAWNATSRASSLLGNDRSWRVHASTAKSTHIRNPVLRYVHKALAHTIYVRRDVTGVTEKELFFLNEGMKKVIHTLPDGTEMVGDRTGNSVATYLLKSFLSYREYALLSTKCTRQAVYLRKSTYLRGQPISGRHNYQFAYRQFEYGLASFFRQTTLTYITVMENIDFEPPIETILEQGQEEEDYAHPGAAGEGRKSAANTALESINTLKSLEPVPGQSDQVPPQDREEDGEAHQAADQGQEQVSQATTPTTLLRYTSVPIMTTT